MFTGMRKAAQIPTQPIPSGMHRISRPPVAWLWRSCWFGRNHYISEFAQTVRPADLKGNFPFRINTYPQTCWLGKHFSIPKQHKPWDLLIWEEFFHSESAHTLRPDDMEEIPPFQISTNSETCWFGRNLFRISKTVRPADLEGIFDMFHVLCPAR